MKPNFYTNALEALSSIETIIPKIAIPKQKEMLRKNALLIQNTYLQRIDTKIEAISKYWEFLGKKVQAFVLKIWNFFGKIEQKKLEITRSYSRIKNLIDPPLPLLELPIEALEHVGSFLNLVDLDNLTHANQDIYKRLHRSLRIRQARAFGYNGGNHNEAVGYLREQIASFNVNGEGHVPAKFTWHPDPGVLRLIIHNTPRNNTYWEI